MKGFAFDPHLIKWIIIGLVFVVRAVAAGNRKRKQSNSTLLPPQSAPAPSPISSPTMNQSQPMSGNAPKGKSKSSSDPDSPWSTTKGPFD